MLKSDFQNQGSGIPLNEIVFNTFLEYTQIFPIEGQSK